MSWAAPPPYAARPRSRSRSPYRGGGAGYPPGPAPMRGYPEPGYGEYRGEWDAYERDRAWATYERERQAMEYGRRGRSRSPGVDDGRKRRRSMSPYDSRYDPRPRYDDYDSHRYNRSPPRGGYSRAPPDPHLFDNPASLKQFAEWFRYFYSQQAAEEDNADKLAEQEAGDGSKPRNGIKSKWEKYKKEFAANQLTKMFNHHRNTPWFQEKYSPDSKFVNLRQRTRQRGIRGRLPLFLEDLESGKYDPEPASTSPAVGETNGTTTVTGEDSTSPVKTEAPAEAAVDEDAKEMGEDDNAGDTNGANGRGADKGADRRDINRGAEVSVPNDANQVMIRTIPPDIGRLKLERAIGSIPGFTYVALGEPMQKRQFYRAAWIKFAADADMPSVMGDLHEKKVEGFKLHVTHLLKPFVNRIRYAPEIASKPERLEKDLANARVLAGLLEAEYEQLRTAEIPPPGAAESNAQKEQKDGDGAKEDGKDQDGGADAKDALGNGNGNGEKEDAAMADQTPMHVLPPLEEEPEALETGSAAVERRAEKLLADAVAAGLVDSADERALTNKKTELALDLYRGYLRATFHTCYYCALTTDHMEELQRRCIQHDRKPLSKALIEEIRLELEREKDKAAAAAAAAEVAAAKEVETEASGDAAMQVDGEEQEAAQVREEGGEDKREGGERKDGEGQQIQEREKKEKENREWKRNDERWLDWLDNKMALLINRDGLNPGDYGGKNYDDELKRTVEPYIKQEDEGKYRCKTCQKLFKATAFVEKHVANKHPELTKTLEELPFFNNFALDPYRIQPLREPPPQQAPPGHYGGPGGLVTGGPGGHDYRGGPGGGGGQGYAHPPPYANGGGYAYDGYGHPAHRGGPGGGRLSDRMGGPGSHDGEAGLPSGVGLPAKPMLDGPLQAGSGGGGGGRSGGGGGRGVPGVLPPPPPDAKEDPRAAQGRRVSYHDMDLVAEGDVELQY